MQINKEPDKDFRDSFFNGKDRDLLRLGQHRQIELGVISEHDVAGRVKQGYLAELREDWETAANCYDSIGFTERKAILQKKRAKTEWALLKASEDCRFRPGSGSPWDKTSFFSAENILNPETIKIRTQWFNIFFSEKTPTSLKGEIEFEGQGLKLVAGKFEIDTKKPYHSTEYLNVAYDTHLRLSLSLTSEDDAEYQSRLRKIAEEKQTKHNEN